MLIQAVMLFGQSTNKAGGSTAQVRTAGWSEAWYIDADATVAKNAMINLCQERAKLLSNAASIVGQRYRIVNGGSSTDSRQFPGSSGLLGDQPGVALNLSGIGDGVVNSRKWLIRGVPDIRVTEGEYVGSQQYDAALASYFTMLDTSGFRFRALDLTSPKAEVISVDATGAVVLKTPLTVIQGNKLSALRIKDASNRAISGTFTVNTVTDGTHFTLSDWPAKVGSKGSFRVKGIIYPEINGASCRVVRASFRKAGGPFGRYRGRRSNRH